MTPAPPDPQSTSSILAFDVGGTRLKAGLVDVRSGTVCRRRVLATPSHGAAALAQIETVGREWFIPGERTPVGLCVPGLVDGGRIIALPGKLAGIVGVDLEARLRAAFGGPIVVLNDAIAFGLGEAHFGAGRPFRRSVVMTIGTGVGVSVLEHGLPLGEGPHGGGQLGGQIPIFDESSGPTDTNGRRGTIEARCAAARIVDAARRHGCRGDDIAALYRAHAARDPGAIAAIAEFQRDLARALIALAHAHAPDAIILGGGPMKEDNPIVEGLEAIVRSGLWPGYSVTVKTAARGDDAALLGVASEVARRMDTNADSGTRGTLQRGARPAR